MASKYPQSVRELKPYFKKIFTKGGPNAVKLYMAAMAASGPYADDCAYDDLDDALSASCRGLMNYCNSEAADELSGGEYYCWILEAVYDVARRAKISFRF